MAASKSWPKIRKVMATLCGDALPFSSDGSSRRAVRNFSMASCSSREDSTRCVPARDRAMLGAVAVAFDSPSAKTSLATTLGKARGLRPSLTTIVVTTAKANPAQQTSLKFVFAIKHIEVRGPIPTAAPARALREIEAASPCGTALAVWLASAPPNAPRELVAPLLLMRT